jgi:uncharacterized protein
METSAVQREPVDAGAFLAWLRDIQASFTDAAGMSVPCGDCRACCTSRYFVHLAPGERAAAVAPRGLLRPAPQFGPGHSVMGHDHQGHCPLLRARQCTVYADRPRTCREYDCRIFAAAGLEAGGRDQAAINERVRAWRFTYADDDARARHDAVRRAARFIRDHAQAFPNGRVPASTSELAILAIKVHTVFLDAQWPSRSPATLANEIIRASRRFDAQRHPRE